MQSTNKPAQLGIAWARDADSAHKRTPPQPSQIGITAGAASWTDGFPPLTFLDRLTAGGRAPSGKDFNGVLNELSLAVQWTQAGGRAAYDATMATQIGGYPKNCILQGTNGTSKWRSTVENNVTDPDGGSPSGWIDESVFGVVINAVNSISALRGVNGLLYGKTIVTGYYVQGDGGGGIYYLDSADTTSADNGGTIIVASDNGRWKLTNQGALINVKQFGAKGDNSADDTAAITAANTYCTATGKILYFPEPGVAYKYSPSAALTIYPGWCGESKYGTVINVSNSYAGEVFRVLPSASLRMMTIQTPGLTKTAGSIGVRISAANTKDECVNSDLSSVFVRGFEKNLDLQNVYVLHANHVHIEAGTEGIYCVPDNSGGLGYITTHLWFNCDIGNNVRNIYYNSPDYSNTVMFMGGNISGATGSSQQTYFNKVRILKFAGTYFEQAASIRAVFLNDVDYVSFDGGLLSGTGGIQVGSGASTRVECRNIWGTTSSDVLTGADGYQMLSLHSCNFGSGSSSLNTWKTLTIEDSNYQGTFYNRLMRGLSVGFKDNSQSGGGVVTLDLLSGGCQRIAVSDTAAFTIAAPVNATPGQVLKIRIQNNSSGGTLGTVTWNAVFKLGAAWVNAASGFSRSIEFTYDGAAYHEENRNTNDIPN